MATCKRDDNAKATTKGQQQRKRDCEGAVEEKGGGGRGISCAGRKNAQWGAFNLFHE